METYKLGNKVKVILRAYSAGKIGNIEMKYPTQPYTILDAVEAQVNYNDKNSNARTTQKLIGYNIDYVESVQLRNVPLTDKILNLIYDTSDEIFCSESKNYNSNNDGVVYLHLPTPVIYDVFIYNSKGELEDALEQVSDNKITVKEPNSNYLLIYRYPAQEGYSLNRSNNVLLNIDMEVLGNEDNSTTKF